MTLERGQSRLRANWFRLFSAMVCVIGLWIPNALAQSSGKFVPTGNLNVPRIGHTATLLNDGRVLIAGGFSLWVGTEQMSAELYNPITGTFALTGNMIHSRGLHSATLLADGRVLIVGGYSDGFGDLATAELYDPATGTFTETGGMQTGRREQAATLLKTGKVLISGGSQEHRCELYDPAKGAFTPISDLVGSGSWANASQLSDGRVLTVGGVNARNASLFDPTTETFRFLAFPGEPVEPAFLIYHTATLLPSGKVLIAGGAALDYGEGAVAQAVVYDPASESFQRTGSLLEARASHTATLLPNGSILIAGGFDGSGHGDMASAELYNPRTGTFAIAGTMSSSRDGHTATLLGDGRVLIVGGRNTDRIDPTAELYVPEDLLWQQVITAMKAEARTDGLNFWQWAWYWQRSPAFPGAPVGFGVLGSIDNTLGLIDKIIATSGGNGFQNISAEQWVLYYRQALVDPWQRAIAVMQDFAGTKSLNFWQWAWYWQRSPAFPGTPAGFGVLGSVDNTPGMIDKIVAAGGSDGFRVISAEQWVLYYLASN